MDRLARKETDCSQTVSGSDIFWAFVDLLIETAQASPEQGNWGPIAVVTRPLVLLVIGGGVVLVSSLRYGAGAGFFVLFLAVSGLVVLVMVVLRSCDIAHVRTRIEELVELPADRDDDSINVQALRGEATPVLRNLHKVLEAVSAARRGDVHVTRVSCFAVERSLIGGRLRSLLDALPLLAEVRSGLYDRGARQLSDVLPTHWPAVDRELGKQVVRDLLGKPAKLLAVQRRWSRAGGPLGLLSDLIDLHLGARSQRTQKIAQLSSSARSDLAALAKDLDERALHAELLRTVERDGPYR